VFSRRLTAVVTGASSGIGEATARRLAREPGAELVLVARREERLRVLAESLPCDASYVAVDLTAAEAPQQVRDHLAGRGDRLTLLVNNAGGAWRGGFAETGYANVERHMALNFDAVVRLTEALLPLLRASAPSAIVNVASTAGRVARARTGAYSASKFALIGWSDALHPTRESADAVAGLRAREGRRGDRRRRTVRQDRALRAALLRDRRRPARPYARPDQARPRRRCGRRPHHQYRRRSRGLDAVPSYLKWDSRQ
jgi:NAD(P)-dependent dehydrogenase (short-subunit alcohol dehydrogenase family)